MIVLDTHAWIWWVTESRNLSAVARKTIEEAECAGVSVMSCWEVSMLAAKGRIAFSLDIEDWIEEARRRPKIKLCELTPKIAVRATRLTSSASGDPVDSLIVATALFHRAALVTKDKAISESGMVKAIW